ncbi:MAG: hypothetical protein BroJett026_36790 [Betaproteobacteria bacterium]|nr:MAG: hypothetical protein BroJett026_36790 [Betaproteobacteria bacterium]
MRWTDLPAPSPVRTRAAWRSVLRERGVDAVLRDALAGPTPAGHGPCVLLEALARDAAVRHVAASAFERGGLLVGTPVAAAAPDGPIAFLHVTRAVPAVHDDATPLALRMDAHVWSAATATLCDGETIVGWFHSHPGIGAFFSDTDRRTQRAFFAHRYSAGWVIDPVRGEHAWFVGADARAVADVRIVG